MPMIKLGKAIEVVVFIAALGVLAENVVIVRQNRQLREDVAPQIAAGAQLGVLSAPTLDGHIEPVSFTSTGSKLLVFTFSPGCR